MRKELALPAAFAGIEISKIGNRDPRYFYLRFAGVLHARN